MMYECALLERGGVVIKITSTVHMLSARLPAPKIRSRKARMGTEYLFIVAVYHGLNPTCL